VRDVHQPFERLEPGAPEREARSGIAPQHRLAVNRWQRGKCGELSGEQQVDDRVIEHAEQELQAVPVRRAWHAPDQPGGALDGPGLSCAEGEETAGIIRSRDGRDEGFAYRLQDRLLSC
jgi:hypothetical protein